MKKTKPGLLILLLLGCIGINAQKVTLNGYITDKKSGERLLGASVFFETKNIGSTSNSYGFYA